MNWTGGSLSRSRKQNANLSVVQKRHFARARERLLHGRPSPQHIDIPIFNDAETEDAILYGITKSVPNHHRERQGSQMTLDQFENIRPVVKQLQSLRPHCSLETTPPTPSSQPQSYTCCRGDYQTNPLPTKKPRYQGPAYFRKANEQLANSMTRSPITTPPAVDELEAKRRELLATFDWVGLERMKPVRMKFVNAEDRDLIGKRRFVKGIQAANNAYVQQHRTPLLNACDKLNIMRTASHSSTSPGKISVRIGSSRRDLSPDRRQHKGLRLSDEYRSPLPDEMLFDDQESFNGVRNASANSKKTIQHPASTSDDMLFGFGSSDGTTRMSHEPKAADRLHHYQVPYSKSQMLLYDSYPSAMNNLSSDSGSGHTLGAQLLEGKPHTHRPQRQRMTDSTHSHLQKVPAGSNAPSSNQLDPDRLSTFNFSEFSEPTYRAESDFKAGHRAPPQDDGNTRNRKTIQSPTCSAHAHVEDPQSARARMLYLDTAQSLGNVVNGGFHGIQKHGPLNAQVPKAIINGSDENPSKSQASAQEQPRDHHNAHIPGVPVTVGPRSPTPVDREDSADVDAVNAFTVPIPSDSQIQYGTPNQPNESQAPQESAPEEDELLWRRFVFGTEDPAEDWTFEEEAVITQFPDAPGSQRPAKSSSPLQPIFTIANNNVPESDDLQTNPNTQPSLVVEASSSPSSLPDEPLDVRTSHSQPRSSSGGPPATQYSIQAQPSISSRHQPTEMQFQSNTSSDPLTCSPSRLPHPPVTFRKPNRYVGESQDAVMPVRLGIGKGKRKRKRKRGMVSGEDDDEGYREIQRRKKGRREWAGGRVEEMSGGEVEEDEIVDD